MKKKLLLFLLMSALSITIFACGKTNQKNDATDNGQESTASDEKEENSTTSSEPKEKINTLKDIEQYMIENGVLSGERTQMAVELIGAIDGFKYNDSDIEVYEYDVNSEEYISLANGEEIPLEGIEGVTIGAVSINDKFVLMGNPSEEAVNIFESFK